MADSFELDPVDWISAGALGDPGDRTFYLQARSGTDYVALIVEKEQVAALANVGSAALEQAGVVVTSDDRDPERFGLEPIVPSWRVGELAFGADSDAGRFVLQARDRDAAETARFWMGRAQLTELVARADHAVNTGARDRCAACGEPLDPGAGHLCGVDGNSSRFVV